eukprot:m.9352 g.9352  ORF g.9352 m.9352 type:complete len:59 (+) comp4165_c0_seq1:676-852(+)
MAEYSYSDVKMWLISALKIDSTQPPTAQEGFRAVQTLFDADNGCTDRFGNSLHLTRRS